MVGSFLSSADQLASCTRQAPYSLPILLPRNTTLQARPSTAVLVFINGLRTSGIGFELQFRQPVFDGNLKQINLSVVTNISSAIENIQFGYILVDLDLISAAGYSF